MTVKHDTTNNVLRNLLIPTVLAATLLLSLMSSSAGTTTTGSKHYVQIPMAYLSLQTQTTLNPLTSDATGECSGPEPYTGDLTFRSRYEGSGKARDRVNQVAAMAYEKYRYPGIPPAATPRHLETGENSLC